MQSFPTGVPVVRSWLTTSRPENSCGGLNWRRPRRIILTADRAHHAYERPVKVRLERVNNEVLAVYGDENDGQYVEIIDMKTGKTVGHKVFPRQQPEPKKEAKEEEAGKIDYQKMAQEARWIPPEEDSNSWTMSVLADGKKVYDWPVPMPSGFFVDSNGVVYHAEFSPAATGCTVMAYDLKGRKLLWQNRLEGLGPVEHSKYRNVVRFERVNDEVIAIYGKETVGRYIEIVDMKTGKTVGHKVFTKEETDKKPGAKAAPPEDDPAVKECQAHLDSFWLTFGLCPPQVAGTPNTKYGLRSVGLHVQPMFLGNEHSNEVLRAPKAIPSEHARITREQAAGIVTVLATVDFFRASITDSKRLTHPNGPYAVLGIHYSQEGGTLLQRWLVLQWDLHMVQQLEALRACVDGDAAKLLDQMLKSLEDERKEWQKKEAQPPTPKPNGKDDEKPISKLEWKAKDDISLAEPQGYMTSVVFTPDSQKLIAGRGKVIRVFDLKTARVETEFEAAPEGAILSIALSPNGQLLAIAGTAAKGIVLWDLAKKKEVARLPGHAGFTQNVSFSPDGKILLSHGRDKSNPAGLPEATIFKQTDYSMRLWNVDKQAELDGFAGGFPGKSAAVISPDGKTLALGDFAGKITIMDMSNRKELRTFADERAQSSVIVALAYSPDGKLLAFGTGSGISLCDPDTGRNVRSLTRTVRDPAGQRAICFTQKGEVVSSGSMHTGSVDCWHTADGRELANLKTEPGDTVSIAVSPDGRWLAASGYNQRIKLWELQLNKKPG